jgi:acylphosphatase
MAPDNTVRLRITGNVQGVGYRIWAVRTAAGLGLRGWVRNRLDGSVEALATGAPEQIAVLIEGCRRGPYGARVAEVTAVPDEDDGSIGFITAVPTE